jgi:uncharacterized membrane protein HdeD (DUF308 family)
MGIELEAGIKGAWRSAVLLSLALILFGLLAIAIPMATSLGVVMVVGWLLLLNGLVQVAHAFRSKGIGHIVWKLVVAALYLAMGLYLVMRPTLGILGFTLALGIFLLGEGAVDLIAYFKTGTIGGSIWILLDAVIALVVGFMILNRWPLGSFWILGTLAGVSMLMTGTTRLMMALAVRKAYSTSPWQARRAA